MAPFRQDRKFVDWDVKPQPKKTNLLVFHVETAGRRDGLVVEREVGGSIFTQVAVLYP